MGRSYIQSSYDISDCNFTRTSVYGSNGGVEYIKDGVNSMKILYSMFYNCSSTSGGAIYF